VWRRERCGGFDAGRRCSSKVFIKDCGSPMEHKHFYHGNYEKEAVIESTNPRKDKWWFVGHFMQEGHRKTKTMGLKYWKFNKGEEVSHKQKSGEPLSTECNLILEGRVRGTIAGEEITLSAGEYVIIPPKTASNLIEEVLEEPLVGLTIKAPNDPDHDAARTQ
jgi:mannose-6-phosphate isomerase-like protein (cupin superfamily)